MCLRSASEINAERLMNRCFAVRSRRSMSQPGRDTEIVSVASFFMDYPFAGLEGYDRTEGGGSGGILCRPLSFGGYAPAISGIRSSDRVTSPWVNCSILKAKGGRGIWLSFTML